MNKDKNYVHYSIFETTGLIELILARLIKRWILYSHKKYIIYSTTTSVQ